MRITTVLSVLALILTFSASTFGLDSKCVVIGPAATQLSRIADEAAAAQRAADELEGYVRSSMPSYYSTVSYMAVLNDHVRQLRKSIAAFERNEYRLTPAEAAHFEKLKVALDTLTLFTNQTNTLIATKQPLLHREPLLVNVKAMRTRAGIVREAARNLRTGYSA